MNPAPPKRASDPRRWDDANDPALSWDEYGIGHLFDGDTPADPAGGIDEVTAKLWPEVHPALQETPKRTR